MKFGQLIEYNKRNTFIKKLCGKWGKKTSSRPQFIFWKSLIWGESNWQPSTCHTVKTNSIKLYTIDSEIC